METQVRSLIYSTRQITHQLLPQTDTATTLLDRASFLPCLVNWCAEKVVGTYVISFPKCGVTWLRLMIAKVLELHFNLTDSSLDLIGQLDVGIACLHSKIPRIRVKHDDEPHKKCSEQLNPCKNSYRYAKVIFLVRDPRDVIVSLYFFAKNRPYFRRISDVDLSSFLRSPIGSFDTLLTYYNIWADNRTIPRDFLLVRYEDMQISAEQELRRVLTFLGLEIKDEIIQEAVDFTQFSNMRKLEEKAEFSSVMKGFNQSDKNSFHVRKGKIGGFREELGQEDIIYLRRRMTELLSDSAIELYQYFD
ncbi:MAG TPA: sulfotransferase domain-containing protein [Allocoleopsis sp.]